MLLLPLPSGLGVGLERAAGLIFSRTTSKFVRTNITRKTQTHRAGLGLGVSLWESGYHHSSIFVAALEEQGMYVSYLSQGGSVGELNEARRGCGITMHHFGFAFLGLG